jgi:hypothetical protein
MPMIQTYDWILRLGGRILCLCDAAITLAKPGFSASQPEVVYQTSTGCSSNFHKMEFYMTDYRLIEIYIQRARLERSRVMGELIANGIFEIWTGAKRLANWTSGKIRFLVESPDEYSTALPRRF